MNTQVRMGDFYGDLCDSSWAQLIGKGDSPETHRIFWNVAEKIFRSTYQLPCLNDQDIIDATDGLAAGSIKYSEVGGWRNRTLDEHVQAAGRHFESFLANSSAVDKETDVLHRKLFMSRALIIRWFRVCRMCGKEL